MSQGSAVRGARGFSLLEVMVVIAMLGLTTGLSTLAFTMLKGPAQGEQIRTLQRGRSEAIESGRPVLVESKRDLRTVHVLFLPDGRALGAGVDPLTGVPRDSAQ